MTTFLSWLPNTIAQWWQFMYQTNVPGCNFTFATLTLFVVAFNLMLMFIGLAMHYRTHKEGGNKK